jgi:PAS domain S-box-containing protein
MVPGEAPVRPHMSDNPTRSPAPLPDEQLARFLRQSVTDYAFLSFGPDRLVTSWSRGAERILGYSESEMLGNDGRIIFTEEDRARGVPEQEINTALRDGRADDERWHLRKDGSRFWASGVMTAIRDDGGNLLGFAKVMRDLTDRQRAQEELKQSERQFQAVAQLVPDLLWRSDPDGTVTWYNDRWCEYTGQRVSPVRGAGWTTVIHPDEADKSKEEFLAAIRSGRPLRQEHRIRGSDGVYRWFLLRAEPVRDEAGKTVQWFGAATEIQDQKAALETRGKQLDAAQDELRALAGKLMAAQEDERRRIARELHDSFGQQLAVLQTDLMDLESEIRPGAPQAQGAMERVRSRVSQVSVELRDLSHRLHPSVLEDLGLAAALRSVVQEFERVHDVRIIGEFTELDGTVPGTLATAIYRIAQEALHNAVKHGDAGISVVVRLWPAEGALHLTVEDNGRGFDPLAVQAKGGMGLVSMRERARLVGGAFEIEAGSQGTQVRLTVPWSGARKSPTGPTVSAAKPRVILADDHEASRYLLRRLTATDAEMVAEVENGQQAVDAVERLRPDLVILDISMPVMGGLEAARLIRQRFPEVRLIFASQHTGRIYADEAFGAGAQGYIVKQAAATEVGNAIREVMGGGLFRSPLIHS